MSYHDWYVGMKVVCVDGEPHTKYAPWPIAYNAGLGPLEQGCVYTIRRIGTVGPYAGLVVWLDEIHRPINTPIGRKYGEIGFAAQRFRPVQTRKTDISVFEAMLNPSKVRADA